MSRIYRLVIGHDKDALACQTAGPNGLDTCLAIVLSTYRPALGEMFMDDALWAACMQAVSRSLNAGDTKVIRKKHLSLTDRLRGKPASQILGTLPEFIAMQAAEPDIHGWDEVHWFSGGKLVACALCEDWFAVGGPDLYHDSYTSRIWLHALRLDDLVAAIQKAARTEGGQLRDIVRLPDVRPS